MNKPRKDAATLLSEIMNTSFDKGSKVGMGEEPLSGGADEPDSRPELSTI